MINELTPQQEQLMHQVREEWLAKIFDPFKRLKLDKDKAQNQINWLYKLCDFEKPKVVFAQSPMHAQYLANVLDNVGANVLDNVGDNVWANVLDNVWDNVKANVGDNVGDNVRANVWDNVGANVLDNVGDNVRANVWDNVWANVGDNVRDNVRANVWDNVKANVRANVWDNVKANVGDNVWANVGDNVRANVWDNVGANVLDNVGDNVGEYHSTAYFCEVGDYGWAAFHDFFARIGITNNENFDQFLDLLESGIWNLITFNNVCIACPLPSHIYRTDPTPQLLQNQKLHSTERMAIEWGDGYGQHYLHGVYFDKELWEKVVNPSITLKEVMAIENMEQRMAAIKTIGYEHLLADAEKVDSSERGNNLYLVKGVFSNDAYFLQYKDPSTDRIYVSGIDPKVGIKHDADLSMAWKFNLTKKEYSNLTLEA